MPPGSLIDVLQRFLASQNVTATAPVMIGCSGGADSMALADAACQLHRRHRLGPVTLAHVDHGLRSESAADARAVTELAATLNANFRVKRVTVARASGSQEDAAREARYQAFAEIRAELRLEHVLLGHTATDQAETVLMRILRGTGVVGLAAIPERRGPYLRPWLTMTRHDIEAYCRLRGLTPIEDASNRELGFFRNRVRHKWIPALRAENPQLEQALCRLARAAQEQRDQIDSAAEQLVFTANQEKAGQIGHLRLPTGELVRAGAAVGKRALAIACARSGATSVECKHLDALWAAAQRQPGGTVELHLPGLRAFREYDLIRFEPSGTIDEAPAGIEVSGTDGPYRVRLWQPGDRMRPARLHGRSRKLSDLFVDAKIPRQRRRVARIVVRESDQTIVWAEFIGKAYDCSARVILTQV